VGDSLVERARQNLLRDWYYDTTDRIIVWLDSDIGFHSQQNFLDLLYEDLQLADVDFVGGLYACKGPQAQCSSVIESPRTTHEANKYMVAMRWLSTGCWAITRDSVTKMIEAFPELEYETDIHRKLAHALFLPMLWEVKDNPDDVWQKLLSEDWAFCERWKQANPEKKIWADTRIITTHWGKYPFRLPVSESESKPESCELHDRLFALRA
jgi:hypothetical protein